MSVGKNPHRPEGKTHSAEEGTRLSNDRGDQPLPRKGEKPVNPDKHNRPRGLLPDEYPATEMEQPMGGSRPGVESRVKEAIQERRDREAEEAE